jgi:hypothetical protein
MSICVRDVAKVLAVLPQIPPYSELFYRYLNAGVRKYFLAGNYVGVVAPYNILLYNGIVALPFDVEAILAGDIITCPVNIQNMWFEFLQNGPGYQDPTKNFTYPDLYDRGDGYATIQDPPGPFTIQINCAVPENPNLFVIVEGLDQNGNVIRSSINTQLGDGTVEQSWINGVQIPLYAAGQVYQTSTQQFSRVTGTIFPADCNGVSERNGDCNIYASTVRAGEAGPAGTQFLLGIYPYFVVTPSIHRYFFPAAISLGLGYKPLPFHALVRRKPTPLSRPTDRIPVENVEALKAYFTSAYKEEEEQWDSATALEMKGKGYLEQEIRKTKGALDRLNIETRGFMGFPRTPGSL